MLRQSGTTRSLARLCVSLAVIASALVGLGSGTARAVTTVVSCDGSGDILDIQGAVNAAGSGDTIQIAGACDFRGALPHGGGVASITATAVLIRPGTPVTNLTIEAAPAQTATILGSGTQTAFAIAPGNDAVTIRGLRFAQVARPMVVLGADNVTIGDSGAGVPSLLGNRLIGDHSMDSGILAIGSDTPMTIQFGEMGTGAGSPVTVTPTSLDGLTVVGNQITYSPVGTPDPAGTRDMVAIDVRQSGAGTVNGVTIERNAVGMFSTDFSSFRHNGVRVEGLAAVPASATPAPSDYRIHDVAVLGNNLGRLEELDPLRLTGVDPDEQHAAGRVGVLAIRVDDAQITDNRVRSRLSGVALGVPGGGVVLSDSAFSEVRGNNIAVAADVSAPSSVDLGGIAVVEGVPGLSGGSLADQATVAVDVSGNQVGVDVPAPFLARRGIVLSGADFATVWENEVTSTDRPSLLVGAVVQGPANTALPTFVKRSTACENQFDGVIDDPAEVAQTGSGHSGNAFPSGSAFAGGGECAPTIATSPVNPTAVQSGGSLTVSGRGWASRAVSVEAKDELGTIVTKAGTAGTSGAYSVVFTSTDLAPLADGVLDVKSTVDHASLVDAVSPTIIARLNFVNDPPPAGAVTINDGDGYTGALETVAGPVVSWSAPTHVRSTAVLVALVDSQNVTPSGCGPFIRASSGSEQFSFGCANALAEGTYEARVTWYATDAEGSPTAVDTSIKDTVMPTVTINTPLEDSTVSSVNVDITGTISEAGTVTIRTPAFPYTVIASFPAAAGTWTHTVAMSEGEQHISAFAVDSAQNEGPVTMPRNFVVDDPTIPGGGGGPADTTPPLAPVITSPADGSVRGSTFDLFGTGEGLATVYIFINGQFEGTTPVDPSGVWGITVHESDGAKSIHAVAVDAAGNVSPASNTLTLTVDSTAPAVTITTPPNTVFGPLDTIVIEGTASDIGNVAFVLVEYYETDARQAPGLGSRIVSQDIAVCSPVCPALSVSWTSTPDDPLLPGFYSVRAIAFDAVGNASDAVTTFIKVP